MEKVEREEEHEKEMGELVFNFWSFISGFIEVDFIHFFFLLEC